MNFSKQKNWDFIISSFDKFFFSTALLSKVKQCWKNLSNERMMKFQFFLFWKIQILNSVFWTIQPFLDLENAKFGIYASKWVKPQNMGSEKWWDLFTNVSKISLWNLHGHIKHCVREQHQRELNSMEISVSFEKMPAIFKLQKVTVQTWGCLLFQKSSPFKFCF